MADVFISYARSDRDWVETLAGEIERAGLTVWWDRELTYGRSFEKTIGDELDAAKAIVVVWSAASLQSDWVKDEAGAGRQRGVLIPVLKDKVAPPLGFKQLHAADLTRWPDEGQRELVRLLAEIGARTGHDLRPAAGPQAAKPRRQPPPKKRSQMRLTLLGLLVAALGLGAVWYMISLGDIAREPGASAPPVATPARTRVMTLQTEGGRIAGLAMSPDGARIAALGERDGAYLWDAKTGAEIGRLGARSTGAFIAFSADGGRIATAALDKALVFDGRDGTAIGSAGVSSGALKDAALSPDGRRIVTLSVGAAQLWDADASALIATLGAPEFAAAAAAFSLDGTRIATAHGDFTARLWDAADGRPLVTLEGHENAVTAVAFSADGRLVVTASDDNTAIVWDAATGDRKALLGFHDDAVRAAHFAPDAARIVTLLADGSGVLWTGAGAKISSLAAASRQPLIDARFTADGKHVLGLDAVGGVYVWAANTGMGEALLPTPAGEAPTALHLSAAATRLLTARAGTVTVETIALP